jgi:soluble lytic murein transglycosylase-like protein
MINRFTKSKFDSVYSVAHLQNGSKASARNVAKSLLATARHSFTATGCTAIAILGLMFFNPGLTEHLKALSPFTAEQPAQKEEQDQFADLLDTASIQTAAAMQAVAPAVTTAPVAPAASSNAMPAASLLPAHAIPLNTQKAEISPQQQRVTNWLSKRYRVAKDATNMLVSAAYATADDIKMDPLLILSVVAIESRFNPFAESPVGAQGLMQVMSKVHRDKFADHGGVKAALNPVANIQVGAKILKEYVKRGGSVEAGLKMYVGAADMTSDAGYGAKVLAEYQRLKDVAEGKKVPTITTVSRVPPKPVEKMEEPKTEALLEKSPDYGLRDQPA